MRRLISCAGRVSASYLASTPFRRSVPSPPCSPALRCRARPPVAFHCQLVSQLVETTHLDGPASLVVVVVSTIVVGWDL